MTFASVDYLCFLVLLLVGYWLLPRRGQNVLLIGASLLFYGWVHPWYVALLLYSATLDFSCGQGIARFPDHKGRFLAASVIGNGLLLGTFKYVDFFVANVAVVLEQLGVNPHLPTLGLLLPVGISFYTFQSLSYTVDVYRGKTKACDEPLTFLLFVSFFPQLVMGPISRARFMLPQYQSERTQSLSGLRSGVSLMMFGAFKKIVVADTISGFVHAIFVQPDPSFAMVWAAAAGASVMMFADFSGYTDLARGSARLFGFELPENFRAPYLATTPAEWWSRWHITFYQWMGEYVFQPLTLNRWCRRWLVIPFLRTTPSTHVVRGVMGTMLLSGLWHGAAWHYVVWGAFFGVAQLVYFFVGRRLPDGVRSWRHRNWLLRPAMWTLVMIGELLFQVRDPQRVLSFLTMLPHVGTPGQWMSAGLMVAVTATLASPMVGAWWVKTRFPDLRQQPAWFVGETTLWATQAGLVYLFYRGVSSDFAYYQF